MALHFSINLLWHHVRFLPRDAMLARYMLWPCVRLCLCLSQVGVLSKWLNVGWNKQHRTIAHSSGSLVFWSQKSPRNSTGVIPYGGAKCRWGGLKSTTFDKWLAISRKRYKIDAWFLLKSNRKSYALYRCTIVDDLEWPLSAPKLPQFVHFSPLLVSS